jgi:hypothetical protein
MISQPAAPAIVEPSRVLRLTNLPVSLNVDAVELLLEKCLGKSFAESPEIQMDSTEQEAIVSLHELSGITEKKIYQLNIFEIFCRR